MDARDHWARWGELLPHKATFKEREMELTVYLEDEEGEETECTFPCKWEVCDVCHGNGKHVSSAIDSEGLTAEDFADDPDFASAYFEGAYDVTCVACKGRRVMPVVDETRANPSWYAMLQEWQDDESSYRQTCDAERRMGA